MDNWDITTERFVAFFDIMGFKDLVERNEHSTVLSKLTLLKKSLQKLDSIGNSKLFSTKYSLSETKSVTFSDSIVIFSKGDTVADLCKIIIDSGFLLQKSLENGIPIKGAVGFGKISVDFDNTLFFGRPIIDAYLLHEQLQIYSVVVDNSFEAKLNSLEIPEPFCSRIIAYKAHFKNGKIRHKFIRPDTSNCLQKQIISISKFYETVSGSPRIYVDNTLEFLNNISSTYNEDIT